MRRLIMLVIIGLLSVPLLMSCSDPMDISGPDIDTVEIPGDTVFSDTVYLPGDTVVIEVPRDTVFIYGDTIFIIVNDTLVDTVYVPCDSTFEDCKVLGNNVHMVSWFRYGLQVVIGSEEPHAFGHEIEICITIIREDDHINVTFYVWREKIQPSQTLDIWLNGQLHVWPLGSEKSSTLNLII